MRPLRDLRDRARRALGRPDLRFRTLLGINLVVCAPVYYLLSVLMYRRAPSYRFIQPVTETLLSTIWFSLGEYGLSKLVPKIRRARNAAKARRE